MLIPDPIFLFIPERTTTTTTTTKTPTKEGEKNVVLPFK
jgi:hypothetical protein